MGIASLPWPKDLPRTPANIEMYRSHVAIVMGKPGLAAQHRVKAERLSRAGKKDQHEQLAADRDNG